MAKVRTSIEAPAQDAGNRLSPDDPALVALNKLAVILEPYDRATQLKLLGSACAQLGMADFAIRFLQEYKLATEE